MIKIACVILTLKTVFATTGNYLHLTANTVTTPLGDPVNHWADSSGNGKHFEGQGSWGESSKPILAQASWNSGIEVVHFGHSKKSTGLKSKSHDIPQSGTFVAVISWTGDGGEYGPIAAAGEPKSVHWSIRRASKNRAIHMLVKGSGTGKIPIDLKTPYVIIGRVNNSQKNCSLMVWDINANAWKGKAQSRIKGIHTGNKPFFLGRAPNKPWEWLDAELALFAVWDYVLTDNDVDLLIEQYQDKYGLPIPTPVTMGNYVHLSANTLGTSFGETVRKWTDSSGTNKNFISRGSCGKPILAQASWDSGIEVVHFGHSQKQTCMLSQKYTVPRNGTFVAVIGWTGDGGGEYAPIAKQSSWNFIYWSVRMAAKKTRAVQLHVKWRTTGKISIDFNTPYVVIGRVDTTQKMSSLWVWDINADDWKGKAQGRNKGYPAGKAPIVLGREYPWQWLEAQIASIAMWDYYLSDDDVNLLVEEYKDNYGQIRI